MKALAFGEILWDVIEDSRKIGGAPLNVLGHIVQLGGEATVISAVGKDTLGDESIEYLKAKGISTNLLKRTEAETGKAIITLKDGIPTYRFTEPSAWDEITLTEEDKEVLSRTHYDAFIYGSLAARSEVSRNTWFYLLENIHADTFFYDVNLRLDFYSKKVIEEGIRHASILKVNDEELPVILELLGINNDDDAISTLLEKYKLEMLLLTSGKKGSDVYTRTEHIHQDTGKVKIVDTVGAGDSLSAAFLYFRANGNTLEKSLRKASLLADYVVQKTGAIPEYDEIIRKSII